MCLSFLYPSFSPPKKSTFEQKQRKLDLPGEKKNLGRPCVKLNIKKRRLDYAVFEG